MIRRLDLLVGIDVFRSIFVLDLACLCGVVVAERSCRILVVVLFLECCTELLFGLNVFASSALLSRIAGEGVFV